jgi:release factor glutamine methyltransferase
MTTDLPALLVEATARLLAAGVPSPRHDAEVLAAQVLGVSRGALSSVRVLTPAQQDAFDAVVRRRESREPLQHITGRAGFRHLDLVVGPGVFIPRPETEVMTGVAVDELRRLVAAGTSPVAADLCSGSGAVAIALATEAVPSRVVALELSPDAAAYAERNAQGTAVEVRVGDLADAAHLLSDLAGRAHVVTANPPYIPLDAWESVDEEARTHDPDVALWSGDDGLDAIRLVARAAGELAVDGGLVLCEHADVQGETAPQVFVETGLWCEVRDHRDLAGRSRYVTARRVARTGSATGTIGP